VSEDFVTRLQLQLREAAEREEQRGRLARSVRSIARGARPVTLAHAAAFALVAAVLAYAGYLATALRGDERPAKRQSGVVARFTPGEALDDVVGGFGSAWVSDTGGNAVLRIDPRTHRVVARIRVGGGDLGLAVGAGSLWALQYNASGPNGPLLRIDPRTNRVVARIALTMRSGVPVAAAGVVASHDNVWVIGAGGAYRLDPASGRFTVAVPVRVGAYIIDSASLDGSALWLGVTDGRLIRLDPRTGVRERVLRVHVMPITVSGALLAVGQYEVRRIDPDSGRALWRVPVGTIYRYNRAGGLLWVDGSASHGPFARLSALDPRTGRVVAAYDTRDFQPEALAAVGPEVWVALNSGRVIVARR
jgi:streptogramin lyase